MADYFTSDHFKLLNKWKGQKRDESTLFKNSEKRGIRNCTFIQCSFKKQIFNFISFVCNFHCDLPYKFGFKLYLADAN